jgi:hypothetical protein
MSLEDIKARLANATAKQIDIDISNDELGKLITAYETIHKVLEQFDHHPLAKDALLIAKEILK